MRAGRYLEELSHHRPDMAVPFDAAMAGAEPRDWQCHPAPESFTAFACESIDYAVMENTTRAAVVVADIGWSDIGSRDAVLVARA